MVMTYNHAANATTLQTMQTTGCSREERKSRISMPKARLVASGRPQK
jgi:hypothetical protein